MSNIKHLENSTLHHHIFMACHSEEYTNNVMRTICIKSRMGEDLSSEMKTVTAMVIERSTTTKSILDWLHTRKYNTYQFGREVDALWGGFLLRSDGCVVTTLSLIVSNTGEIRMNLFGDEFEIETVRNYVESVCDVDISLIETAYGFKREDLQVRSSYIPARTATLACDSFYPWLGEAGLTLKQYFTAFMASKESILLLLGRPGTAKSTFIRSLIHFGRFHAVMAYDRKVVESSALVEYFYESDARILGYEDIDVQVSSRKEGNSLMPTLLNASEGVILYPEKKIVISTNLDSVKDVDEALLREGRCYDVLQFDALTIPQAQRVLRDLGRPIRDLSSKEKWTVGELLADENPIKQRSNRIATKFGFTR